ncbi:hypothetical protein HYPSUDRAFT_143668 [Hypholoma sublateritium FD-334 SS-4]|uniref:DNA2/NAM7 helicase-like C-terminal domain-containing protein n=1 Tax=Hypholoma sublateritium (strain FD-334 SS-4) TaxID=945553 RepID=A0A0D2M879_HYPSF|nr:hypothetical protein HYPSUDRAFT_143668 [Hypholoma sublateritium FD-334 SS-4]
MRAWVSQLLRELNNGEQTFEKVKRIDTKKLPVQVGPPTSLLLLGLRLNAVQRLDMISKIGNDSLRLDSAKPMQSSHRITQTIDPTTGDIRLDSQDYHNKLRYGADQRLAMKVDGTHGQFTVNGSVASVLGKAGYINTGPGDRKLTDKVVGTVISIGRDDPTTAEAQRAATILHILQGSEALLDESPWIQNIWFPDSDNTTLLWPKEWKQTTQLPRMPLRPPPPQPSKRPLNASQQLAVNTMVSETDEHRITIIQGPPGTGKTSVIASFVDVSVNSLNKDGIWLVAQSNVAVKNIAEKLITSGFTKWKILYFAFRHEHIYEKAIEDYLIRSDQFFESTSKSKLSGVSVILCTLSMLSNKFIYKFTSHIPLRTLVVDEASQIEIGQYISVFSKFKTTLRKACFIGDDKQLPPYGQEDLQDLQSIFEVPHLKKSALFLDTQYRMPPQIGKIISKAVYGNKLNSNPLHPVTDQVTACYFIDVGMGKESQASNGSFKNEYECQAVLQLAEKLQAKEIKFKIITPYAAQTTHIEESLKKENLNWADKCFNVDAFQGFFFF